MKHEILNICEHAGQPGECVRVEVPDLEPLKVWLTAKRDGARRFTEHDDLAVSAGAVATIAVCEHVLAALGGPS